MTPPGCNTNFMSNSYQKKREKEKSKITVIVKGGKKSKIFPLL